MSVSPQVSVVLPVRNGAEYLGAAIASILGQSLENIELIVVDDHSTDNSRAVADAARSRDRRVRVVQSSGGGIVDALETGISSTSGPLIARMDADDVSLPHRLELQRTFFERKPEIALVGGFIDVIDPFGRLLRQVEYPTDPTEIDSRILQEVCFASPTMMIRREAFDRVGGFRRLFEPAEDVDLALRIAESYSVANIAQPVLRYRVHGENVSVSRLRRQMQAVLVARAASRRRREGWGGELIQTSTLEALQHELALTDTLIDEQSFEAALTWSELLSEAGLDRTSASVLEEAATLAEGLSDPEERRARVEIVRTRHEGIVAARDRLSQAGLPSERPSATVDDETGAALIQQGRRARRPRPVRVLGTVRRRTVRGAYRVYRGGRVLTTEGPSAFVERCSSWRQTRRSAPPAASAEVVIVDVTLHDPVDARLPARDLEVVPEISIVVPVWNALEYARECVESILTAASVRPFEIIVVDNGSKPDVIDWLVDKTAQVHNLGFVRLPANAGFARAANIGVRLSRGRNVVLLNSDTLVTDGWSDRLIDALDAHPDLGLVSPVTNYVGEGDQIDPAAEGLDRMRANDYAWSVADRNELVIVPERIAFFCVALKRELFDRLNGLDEGYGLGNFEDEDFCLRTQLVGQRIGVLRRAFVFHHGSKTFEVNDVSHSEWMVHNHDRYVDKIGRSCTIRPVIAGRRCTATTVSVVIRTKNRPDGLRVALNSLAWQTFRDFEVVVVNDGGEDVEGLVKGYDGHLMTHYVLNDTGKGRALAGNDGVEVARGRYVTYLDDDDIVYPFHLATLVHAVQRLDPAGAFVYSNHNLALVKGQGAEASIVSRVHLPPWSYLRPELLVQNRPAIHTWLYSRALYDRFGGFDSEFAILQDWEFLLRLTEHVKLVGVPRETCEYRIYLDLSNSLSGGRIRVRDELREIYDRYPCETADAKFARQLELEGLTRQIDAIADLQQKVDDGQMTREHAARIYVSDVFGFPAAG